MKEYKQINGCSKQLECQQVFWAFSFLGMITLYSVMMVPPIFKWNNIPLIVFMAILYALFIPIAYDYMFLSCQDPVDRRIYEDLGDETDTKLCSKCQRRVSKQTYHCLRCDRCTFKLDHHSHLVNNCVSLENFRNYIRMTFCFNLLTLNMTVQCLVIFFFSLSDQVIASYLINRWIIMFIAICSLLSFLSSLSDLIFSCYVRYNQKMSKIDYIYRDIESNNSQIESSQRETQPENSQKDLKDKQVD